jgi:glyoxylase-like metal-dependent hydrolase (beta-lactamase superfamily II)
MENFVYLIHDHTSGRAAIVDPAWEVSRVLELAASLGARVTDILLTHSHHDHVNGVDEVLAAHDAELHLLRPEAQFWGHPLAHPSLHHGGERITLGASEIEILHTPGHTPGSACYRIDGDLITGDTLFVFGCGRCDLRGGDPEQMFQTLRHLREALPANTVIHPGHNYAEPTTSTLGEQAACNPFMHFDDVAEFTHYRMHLHDRIRHTPYPPECR